VGRALARLPGRTAVIASGDMSHRLRPGAPAGYDPDAERFDQAFVQALREDDWPAALGAEPRARAAEDVVDSTAIAMSAAGSPQQAEVLAYEGPWGVGYAEAVLADPQPPLYAVARRAIADLVAGRRRSPPPGGPASQGVFVSLHRQGELRGCMGHVEPRHGALYEEVDEVARLAASRDPRFPALGVDELDDLELEVSVLEPPEPAWGPQDLDPAVYGVIATSVDHPGRGALLLPGLAGVETVEQQLHIVRRKAGIGPREGVTLERFTVRKEAPP
jgi:AmmeMemoRadiSam system protein A